MRKKKRNKRRVNNKEMKKIMKKTRPYARLHLLRLVGMGSEAIKIFSFAGEDDDKDEEEDEEEEEEDKEEEDEVEEEGNIVGCEIANHFL